MKYAAIFGLIAAALLLIWKFKSSEDRPDEVKKPDSKKPDNKKTVSKPKTVKKITTTKKVIVHPTDKTKKAKVIPIKTKKVATKVKKDGKNFVKNVLKTASDSI